MVMLQAVLLAKSGKVRQAWGHGVLRTPSNAAVHVALAEKLELCTTLPL